MGLNADLAQAIGNNIRSLMESRSVTIVELAKALSISRQTLQNYLKGANIIDSVKLIEIADYLGVPVSELFASESPSNNLLFRTALNYQAAEVTIYEKIFNTINTYYQLTKALGTQASYFPEQYNLMITIDNSPVNINYDCSDYFSSKLKMTEELKNDLKIIASEQRNKLGLYDCNAITAISILQQKGINIFFVDFDTPKTFGLSFVDEEKGCYIFVNTNKEITLERMIFTVFHEYAHIVLHRPLYKKKLQKQELSEKKDLLDKMADAFAGYFLVPEEQLANYKTIFHNLYSIKQLFPIKKKFQVSLQTLVLAAGNYHYVSKSFINSFFNYLDDNELRKVEPESIEGIPTVKQAFDSIKNERIYHFLQEGYFKDQVDKNTIQTLLWVDDNNAQEILHAFMHIKNMNNIFDDFFN